LTCLAPFPRFPRSSQYPIVIKAAESSQLLKEVFEDSRKKGILNFAFIREMMDMPDDEELDALLRTKPLKDIEFLGVGMFGGNEELKELTKEFSLWK
jgi:hypothetical protein